MKTMLSVLVATTLSSCASIITGGTDDILVTSSPDGAYFRTNLGQSGRTPMTISVEDDKAVTVSFQLDGYEGQSASVGTRLSAWVLGNIVFGGLIGLVIDVAADGKVHKTDHIHAELYPAPPRAAAVAAPTPQRPPPESFDTWASRQTPQLDIPRP